VGRVGSGWLSAAAGRGGSFEIWDRDGDDHGQGVAPGFIRSKVKCSEWRNFGVERLLGAANGGEPVARTHETRDACG